MECNWEKHYNGTTPCDAMGKWMWQWNGREGGLLHNNQQKDGGKGHVANGVAWNVVFGIGGEANNFYQHKKSLLLIVSMACHCLYNCQLVVSDPTDPPSSSWLSIFIIGKPRQGIQWACIVILISNIIQLWLVLFPTPHWSCSSIQLVCYHLNASFLQLALHVKSSRSKAIVQLQLFSGKWM